MAQKASVEADAKRNPVPQAVSASGAMIILAEDLPAGTKLWLQNPRTNKKIEADVVCPPQLNAEGSLVPIEFSTSSPQFWNIFFPPNSN
jgi:hypothetical protein